MNYLLDTNTLLLMMSSQDFEAYFEKKFLPTAENIAVSIVVIVELKGIAMIRRWGNKSFSIHEQRLNSFLVLPIS